jgi:hypothetical protein
VASASHVGLGLRPFGCSRFDRPLPSASSRRSRAGEGLEEVVRLLAVGELATPPVSGTGDRRFDSCRSDEASLAMPIKGRAGLAGATVLRAVEERLSSRAS